MTNPNLALADGYKATIDKISNVQAKISGDSGAAGLAGVNATGGTVLIAASELKAAIGDVAYNALAATTLTAINTALSTAKTTAQTALTAL